MKRIEYIIRLLLVILMLAFIWGQSLMPGEVSGRESEWVLQVMEPVVKPVTRQLNHMGFDVDEHYVVRKMAHFTEYMVLGGLMFLLFVRPDENGRYLRPALLCLASAGVDEGIIQRLSRDRGPALGDVWLDFAGSCLGIGIAAFLILILYRGIRRRRSMGKNA